MKKSKHEILKLIMPLYISTLLIKDGGVLFT